MREYSQQHRYIQEIHLKLRQYEEQSFRSNERRTQVTENHTQTENANEAELYLGKLQEANQIILALKNSHSQSLFSLRQEWEKEKQDIQQEVAKLQQMLNKTLQERDQNFKPLKSSLTLTLPTQLQNIAALLNKLQSQVTQDIQIYHREKVEYQLKVDKLSRQLRELKGKVRNQENEETLMKKLQACGGSKALQNSQGNKEDPSTKTRIQSLKQQIQKLEVNEKKLKNLLIEREQQYETEVIDLKRMLNQERRATGKAAQHIAPDSAVSRPDQSHSSQQIMVFDSSTSSERPQIQIEDLSMQSNKLSQKSLSISHLVRKKRGLTADEFSMIDKSNPSNLNEVLIKVNTRNKHLCG